MANKIDSNVVGLSYAEETSLKVLPGVGGVDAIWRPLEPNEFGDFGAEIKTVARNPINESRQLKKGVVSDLDASGSITQDVTSSNLTRLMQGFFFADIHEKVSTDTLTSDVALKATVSNFAASTINVAAGHGTKFATGMLIYVSGMANAINNGLMKITAIASDALTVSVATVTETFPVTGNLKVVGFELADNTASVAVVSDALQINISSGSFLTKNLNVGEWIYIGGDLATTRFTQGSGYARIHAITATQLVLKEATWASPVTEAAAAGKTIRIFTGSFLRNEKTPSLIKTKSYSIERVLGQDANGFQSEILKGAVANEYMLDLKTADKLTTEISFVAMNQELRNGTQGLLPGTRISISNTEDAYNTSSDVVQMRIFINSSLNRPTSLFAYAQDGKITLKNNVSGAKAIGVLGSFDVNVGSFEVEGELTVYFTEVAAITAIKANSNVGFNLITAHGNTGIVYDIPLLSLSDGRAEVKKDEPITLKIKESAAENEYGFTMSQTYFHYLPVVAIPVV